MKAISYGRGGKNGTWSDTDFTMVRAEENRLPHLEMHCVRQMQEKM